MLSKSGKRHNNRLHPTGETLRVFKHFSWLEVDSVKTALSCPAHLRVTHTVRRRPLKSCLFRGGDVLLDHDNLEEFSDPINYDMEDRSDTGVAFYRALAQEAGGSVLEIACGTGRVTIPIAKLGLRVTGLDIVPGMLAQARSKSLGLPVHWVEGDARTFDLGEHFRLIFLTGNAFQAFVTNAEQEALLQRVRAHLDDQGLFAFEIRNPLLPNTKTPVGFFVPLETNSEEKHWPSFINADRYEVHVSTTQVYDHVAQVVHLTSYKRWHDGKEEHTKIARTALRYTFPQELAALLHYNGLTIIRQYGDWDLEPLTATSPSIISVCCKRT
jgi:SAM-dependent methyltransferase